MKKILTAAIFAAILFAFSGCVAMSVDTSKKAEYQASVGTPEDSVVFYGFITCNTSEIFSQMNPDFPPDCQDIGSPAFISKPVAPGSTYVLEYQSGSERVGNVIYQWGSYYSLQMPIAPITINVPKKPGLYYVGVYEGRNIARGKYEKSENYTDASESFCLECAMKLYEGTAWEKAILERMEELKQEKAEKKNAK